MTAVTIIVANGPLKGSRHVFEEPASCEVGRAADCEIRLPTTPDFLKVSRHHCLLEIDPPEVRVCDTGSRNGTFVNGVVLGEAGEAMEETDRGGTVWRRLKNNDEIRVGDVYLRVSVGEPAEVESSVAGESHQPS